MAAGGVQVRHPCARQASLAAALKKSEHPMRKKWGLPPLSKCQKYGCLAGARVPRKQREQCFMDYTFRFYLFYFNYFLFLIFSIKTFLIIKVISIVNFKNYIKI